MGAPSDPSQSGADLTDLWPPLSGLFGPASPQQWAWALAQYAQQQGGGAPAPQGDGAPDWPGATPANQVWADAVQNVGRVFSGGAQDGTGQASPADASASPPPTAMAAADAPDQDEAPEQDASLTDAGSDVQPGPDGGAIPASAVAEPSAAQVPISPAPSGGQMPPASSALNPSEQFLRPELSAGPDPLVAALAGDHPNNNPFGFIVDPKTGAVSRPSFGGDPLHPGQVALAPVGPQGKQRYLEWRTGARAKYPLGEVSPEEQTARYQLQQGALPGAKGPPISATASGNTVTYTLPDGRTFPFTSKGHPDRDQNPQDIKWKGGFAQRHGAIGQDGDFAIFPTLDQGRQAAMALMHIKATNGVEHPGYPAGTLADVVRQLSPPSDKNPTERMIRNIGGETGLDRNAKFESLTAQQKQAFARAYERAEGLSQFPTAPPDKVR